MALNGVPPRARLTVDLGAVGDNYDLVRLKAAGAEAGAVVKADAYGLGAKAVAPALAARGCRQFFVATAEEGAALAPVLADVPGARLYVLGACPEGPFVPVINSPADLALLRARARRRAREQPAALHIDTGMNRLGLPFAEAGRLLDDPRAFEGIALTLVMSHLACADTPGHPLNDLQRRRFAQLRQRLPGVPASLANSAGTLLGPDYRFELVRPGIALYGGNPMTALPNLFLPTVTLEAPVLQVRVIDKDDSVGYAASYRAEGPARIATVAAGYADGFLRAAGNRGSVRIGGYAASIVGRVSMDLLTVDVTGLPEAVVHPGAMAQLVGKDQPLDAVAQAAGTISYEVLTRLGGRIERCYVQGAPERAAFETGV